MQASQALTADVEPVTAVKPFQIRGRFFTAVALRLEGAPDDAFYAALDAQLRQMPHFFVNAPFVIDLERAEGLGRGNDLVRLIDALKRRELAVFGVQNGTPEQTVVAREAGLMVLPGGRDVPVERVERHGRAQEKPSEAPAVPVAAPTTLITDPVRSGQTVIAERGDLVVVSSVGAGAELVAAGSIHVYGHLRGRALAGVNGDETARIFCASLDAELLAIAGLYQTSEDLSPELRKCRVQAYLRDDKLIVEPLV